MTEITSSRTISQQTQADVEIISSSFLKKNLKNKPEPAQRRTLKLKSQTFLEDAAVFCETSTKKLDFSQKRRATANFAAPIRRNAKKLQESADSLREAPIFTEKVRLFDARRKKVFEFRCFHEKSLNFPQKIAEFLVKSRQDNDVETDEETLRFYVKRCEKDLVDAVSAEKLERKAAETAKKAKK